MVTWAQQINPIDVAIYAHGGLTDEDGAAKTAEAWVAGFFATKVFPIFMMIYENNS